LRGEKSPKTSAAFMKAAILLISTKC